MVMEATEQKSNSQEAVKYVVPCEMVRGQAREFYRSISHQNVTMGHASTGRIP
jgi:hypothetical protein